MNVPLITDTVSCWHLLWLDSGHERCWQTGLRGMFHSRTAYQLTKYTVKFSITPKVEKRWAARLKGAGLYLAKRGCDEISSFVAMKINLLPSNSLTHANEEMASNGSDSISFLTINNFFTGLPRKGRVNVSNHETRLNGSALRGEIQS